MKRMDYTRGSFPTLKPKQNSRLRDTEESTSSELVDTSRRRVLLHPFQWWFGDSLRSVHGKEGKESNGPRQYTSHKVSQPTIECVKVPLSSSRIRPKYTLMTLMIIIIGCVVVLRTARESYWGSDVTPHTTKSRHKHGYVHIDVQACTRVTWEQVDTLPNTVRGRPVGKTWEVGDPLKTMGP